MDKELLEMLSLKRSYLNDLDKDLIPDNVKLRFYYFGDLHYKPFTDRDHDKLLRKRLGYTDSFPKVEDYLKGYPLRKKERIKRIIEIEDKVYKACMERKIDYSILHFVIKPSKDIDTLTKLKRMIIQLKGRIRYNQYLKEKWIAHVYALEVGEEEGKWHIHLMVYMNLDIGGEEIEVQRLVVGDTMYKVSLNLYSLLGKGNRREGMLGYHISYGRMRYPERCYVNREDKDGRISGIDYVCYLSKVEKKTGKKIKEGERLFGTYFNPKYHESMNTIGIYKESRDMIKAIDYIGKWNPEEIYVSRIRNITRVLQEVFEFLRICEEKAFVYRISVETEKPYESIKEGISFYNRNAGKHVVIGNRQIYYCYQVVKKKRGFRVDIISAMVKMNDHIPALIRTDLDRWVNAFGLGNSYMGHAFGSYNTKECFDVLSVSDMEMDKLMTEMKDFCMRDGITTEYIEKNNARMFGCIMRKKRKNKNA